MSELNLTQIHVGDVDIDWEKLGSAQIESLFAFCIDEETERTLEPAVIEERVETRIIRRKQGLSG